jgi:DNA replication protein DnaC
VPQTFTCVCELCLARDPNGLPTHKHEGQLNKAPRIRLTGGLAAMFITEADLVAGVRAKRTPGALEVEDVGAKARRVQILILDELGGTSEVKEWILDLMQSIVSDRYNNGLPTLYTSNVPLVDEVGTLRKKYGDRFLTRIIESVGPRRYVLRVPWRTA